MARDLRVKVRLEADTKNAQTEVGKATKSFAALNATFAKFAIGAAAGVAAIVGVTRAISGLVSASSKQIDAENALNASLLRMGNQAAATSQALREQAAALELTTRFGDESVIQAQALLSTFGLTAKQLTGATQATVDLAAAFGLDLQSAARNVGRTFSGTAGELAELIPALKELDATSLKAGGALRVISDIIGGRAAEDAKTFSGRMDQLGNAFGTLNEKLGDAITRNRDVSKSLGELRDVIASAGFVGGVENLAKGIASVASASVRAAQAIPDFLRGIRDTKTAFQQFRDSGTVAGDATDLLILKLNQLATPIKFALGGYGDLARAAAELGRVNREQADLTAEVARNEQLLQARRGKLTAETAAALPIFEGFAALLERANTAQETALSREETIAGRDAEALKALNEATTAAGLSVKLLSEELAKQQAAIEAAQEAFNRGAIGVERYEAILKAASDKMAELNGTAKEAGDGMKDFNDGIREGTGVLRDLGNEADATRGKIEALNTSAGRSQFGSGNSAGVRARSRRSQAFVDRAIAAGMRPNNGRIRGSRGGSRLVI